MVALIVAGRENVVLRMTTIAVLFNLVGNLIVVPHFGMVGAASTTLATEVLRALLAAAYARESGFTLLPARRMWKSALATALMAGVLLVYSHAVPSASHGALAAVAAPLAVGVVGYTLALSASGGIEWRRGRAPALRV
jgi:O-antigen/teichoic acid export membrane protein